MIYKLSQNLKMKQLHMFLNYIFILFFVVIVSVPIIQADTWSGYVSTNTSGWYLSRQSSEFTFSQNSLVTGNITPIEVTPSGRRIQGYLSLSNDLKDNDVSTNERTSAQKGNFDYQDSKLLHSWGLDNLITESWVKLQNQPSTIEFTEQWPVYLAADRSIRYSGTNINDRDLAKNNMDYAKNTLLYNKEFWKDTSTRLSLVRMNSTIIGSDTAILAADFEATKNLQYLTRLHTTGIADLAYRMTGSSYDPRHRNYPAVSEDDERYYGSYDLYREIRMNSAFPITDLSQYDWLPCSSCEIGPSLSEGYNSEAIFNANSTAIGESHFRSLGKGENT